MEKREFIEALQELIEQEDILNLHKEVKDLRTQFEDYLLESERQQQIAQLEAEEKGEELEEDDWIHPLKEEFYNLYHPFNDKYKALKEAQKREEEENLQKKRVLLARFKDIVSNEENIGAAFGAHKEINEEWKAIGEIPRNQRHEIQQEYSRLLEEFFYNMRIYKEIKEYDLEKNFDAKKDLISRLKSLHDVENIREMESGLKSLQDEWEDIGPTKQELWEEIKDEYWGTVNELYGRIREFYETRRETMRENLNQKIELNQKIQEIIDKSRSTIKDWNKHTDELLKLQEVWRKIGFGPRKENKDIWKTYRELCDTFFDAKSEFFKTQQSEFDKIAEAKQKLIEEVNQVKDNTDWGETTKQIIQIQKRWKQAGNAGPKFEQKLWKKFRGACDEFFNAKEAHYQEIDKEFEDNLQKKLALIEEIKNHTLSEDKKEAIEQLKMFSEQFTTIGFVPRKKKDEVYKAYKSALNKHYESLDMKGVEKEKVMFEAKINLIKGSGDSAYLFRIEKENIRKEIDIVKRQILQYENNLGFFAHSKGKNPLKEQVEKNIKTEQEKLQALLLKLKMIPNE